MENLKVASTEYPNGTRVKYLFGMKKPEILYSIEGKDIKAAMEKKRIADLKRVNKLNK